MLKSVLPIAILFLAVSCKLKEKPEFVRVNTIDVIHADLQKVQLKAEAVFMNHNRLGGTLYTDSIDVFVDDNLIAKVSSKEFKVPAKDEFVVPLLVNFDTSKLIESENNNLLGSLLKQFLNKKINVRFKGDLTYKVAGFSSSYPIDHIEEVQIK
ncbi:MAG: hypothetical protein AB8B59_07315 [Maribacter sp.]